MVRTSRPLVERMTLVWHDWFATSNDGVGSQKLMLEQNRLLRRHALGRFDTLLARDHRRPGDADLALRHRQPKGAPNENYAPGADGAVHPRRGQRVHRAGRPRAGARADRLRRTTGRAARARPTSASTRRGTTRARRRVFGKRGNFDWRDAVRALPSSTRSTPPFFVDKLWSYFVPVPPDAATRRGLGRALPRGLRGAARARGDPPPPRAVHRPAHGQAARRLHRRAAARARPRGRHDAWVWLADGAGPAPLHPAERRRLGRRALARHGHVPRPLVRSPTRARSRSRCTGARRRRRCRTTRRRSSKGALAVLGNPTIRPETRAALLGFARRLAGGRRPVGRQTAYRRSSRTPCASCSPSPPTSRPGADGPLLRRLHARRADAPRRGRGRSRAAGDRARHAGAGRAPGSTGARSSPAASGSRWPSTAARRCGRSRSRRASRRPPRPAPQRVLVSVFLDGGADSLSMLVPDRRPALPQAAAAPGAGRSATARHSRRTRRLRWHPSLAPLATLHGEGKVTVMPGVGYDRPEPVALHVAPLLGGRRDDERLATGWLGRYLDRVGLAGQPAAGPLARLAPAALARDGEDAGRRRSTRRTATTSGRAERVGRRRERMLDTIGALGAISDAAAIPASRRPTAARQSARLYEQLAPFRRRTTQAGSHEPGRLPGRDDDDFPRRLAGLAAMLAARAAAARASRCRLPGWYDTHDNQPQRARRRSEADGRLAARLPARPRGARARRPRARPRLVGVRPAREGERLGRHRPRRRRRRLPDRLARERHDDRRVPRAREARRRTATSAPPPTSAGSTARCSRTGSAPTPRRSSPAPGSSRRPTIARGDATRRSPLARRSVAPSPARVQVSRGRVPLALSRPSIGRARRSSSSSTTARTSTTSRCAGSAARARTGSARAPGRRGELEARLLAGRYALWCTLADHRGRGMRATLVVRRG